MKILVLAGEPVSAERLREAVGDDVDPGSAEVMVVAPALQDSAMRFWFSDVDEAIARAQSVREETVDSLSEDGISANSDTGEADPAKAIEDALQTFPADRILIFTTPGATHYREEVDPAELGRRYGIPVTLLDGA